jgi:hypothetical protein
MSEDKSYYIEAKDERLPSIGYMLECPKCKRKIHVAMGLIGTVHHFTPTAMCAECLEITDEFRKEFLDICKQIEEWRDS